MWFALIPAIFFGWSLGANDAANVYGTAVTNGLIKFRTAVTISAIMILIGAMLEGSKGLETISSISTQTIFTASITTLAAAISMTLMTYLGLPASSSQAMVGALLGIGILNGTVEWGVMVKVIICWVATPIGSAFFGFILYKFLGILFKKIKSLQVQDITLKISAIVIGAYGSYALGANNVANVTGPFAEIIPIKIAALIGALAIGFGVISFSKKVMYTVGKEIVILDHFSSVIAVLSLSITVWIFAIIGVPVSTSQAIVGAVIGAGLARGSRDVNLKILKRIGIGWLETPLIAGIVSSSIYLLIGNIFNLK